MGKDLLAMGVEKALKTPGCPMCAYVQESIERCCFFVIYGNTNNPGFREELMLSGGFCHDHAWLLQKTESDQWQDGLSTALLYEQILSERLAALDVCSGELRRASAVGRSKLHSLLQRVPFVAHRRQNKVEQWPERRRPGLCPACRAAARSEETFAFGLLYSLRNGQFEAEYQASDGLCIPHLAQIPSRYEFQGEWQDTLYKLLSVETSKIRFLLENLKEYIRKHDYRFVSDPPVADQTAWIRAVQKAVGNKLTHQVLPVKGC